MPYNDLILIEHILECISLIEEYLDDKDEGDFFNSTQLQDSIIRRIEVIGEAIKNISISIKENYPDIRWREITGMRDILIHEYFGVDLDLTWQAATKDILELKEQLLEIKKKLNNLK